MKGDPKFPIIYKSHVKFRGNERDIIRLGAIIGL